MSKGLFVTFEGGEGTGKSTVIEAVSEKLLLQNIDTTTTYDPGGTILSEKIRNIVKHDKDVVICERSDLYLFCAARANMVSQIIKPNLEAGKVILCDRFSDSTIVYQGLIRGYADKLFLDILEYASYNIKPDLTFLLDLDVETALKRVSKRNFYDRFDAMDMCFHKKVRECYKMVSERYKNRIIVIDATDTIGNIADIVYNHIMHKLSTS